MNYEIDEDAWFKASASAANGNCTELAGPLPDGSVAMRDSKDPDGPRLRFGRSAFAALIADANAGELDWLVDGATS